MHYAGGYLVRPWLLFKGYTLLPCPILSYKRKPTGMVHPTV